MKPEFLEILNKYSSETRMKFLLNNLKLDKKEIILSIVSDLLTNYSEKVKVKLLESEVNEAVQSCPVEAIDNASI